MRDPDFLQARLDALRSDGRFRSLPPPREGVDFWSNDYLGFSRLLRFTEPAAGHAPGSRLISGNSAAAEELERRIARFHGHPAALLFGSGYLANLGLLSCLARRTDTIVYDEFAHASLRDGIRLSGATARRCRHNDLNFFARSLSAARSDGQLFVVTESRFSMDGDTAPLPSLVRLCREYGARLIVDEAHATGLDGPSGAGLVAEYGLQAEIFATVVTYGKAPGYHGAAVLGHPDLRDYLVNFCRPFVYTTAPPPAQLAGLQAVYDLLASEQGDAVTALKRITDYYLRMSAEVVGGVDAVRSGPIQIIPVPGDEAVMEAESQLGSAGYLVKGIRSPTVAAGSERLRVCLHAFNSEAEVDGLLQTLSSLNLIG